jgi:hypothetical protein
MTRIAYDTDDPYGQAKRRLVLTHWKSTDEDWQ